MSYRVKYFLSDAKVEKLSTYSNANIITTTDLSILMETDCSRRWILIFEVKVIRHTTTSC